MTDKITNKWIAENVKMRLPVVGSQEWRRVISIIEDAIGRRLEHKEYKMLVRCSHVQHGDAVRTGKTKSQKLAYRTPPGFGGWKPGLWAQIKGRKPNR